MSLHESGQMYLESILVLQRQSGAVRSIDIVEHMGYSKPSVSRAVGILKADEYSVVDKNGYITLTEKGKIDLTITGSDGEKILFLDDAETGNYEFKASGKIKIEVKA